MSNENQEDFNSKDLEALIEQATNEADNIKTPELKPPVKNVFINFDDLRKTSTKKAKDILKKLISFYLTEEMIKDTYTVKKVSIDIVNLSNCMFQLATSEYAVVKVLEEIDSGLGNDKIFKVLSDLQKQNMETMKYNKQYIQIIEKEYEEYASKFEENKKLLNNKNSSTEEIKNFTVSNEKNIHRGSKSLIEALNKLEKENKEEENKEEDLNDNIQ
jgi:ABC-type antimicrobial peptide transport system permease subunit